MSRADGKTLHSPDVNACVSSAATIGEALRRVRELHHATLSDFAERLSISAANLCDIEQGRRVPGLRRVAWMAARLGMAERPFVELAFRQLLRREKLDYEIILKRSDKRDKGDSATHL